MKKNLTMRGAATDEATLTRMDEEAIDKIRVKHNIGGAANTEAEE